MIKPGFFRSSVLVLALVSTTAAGADLAAHSYGAWGFDLAGRDTSVRPGDDFFAYANGAYLARTQIPSDLTWYGTISILVDLSEARVHAILDASANNGPTAHDRQGKIGAFYKAFMDEHAADVKGAGPLAPDLVAIRAVADRSQLAALMGAAPMSFQGSLFDLGIGADDKNPDRYAVFVNQGGLGLPDRDYYLQPSFAAKKTGYEAYVAQVLGLIGWRDPVESAKAVVAFETAVAEASWSKAEERDALKTYNPMTIAELSAAAPGFDWKSFFAAADLGANDGVIVGAKTAVPKIAAIYAATPMATLKAYQAFHLADAAAPFLSSTFVETRFAFRGRTLTGQPALPPRWKRAVRAVSAGLDEAIGQVYVAQYFGPQAKAKMAVMVDSLKSAYRARIQALTWMSPETKARAIEKLASLDVQIGFPKTWKDYASLSIRSDDLYGDVERSEAWRWRYQLDRLNKPVDRDEWVMAPQTVNAYNDPNFNEIVFPAAILQPPFFDPKADAAVNYGAIGAVMGHEMSHGFDDQGRHYDAHGRLSDWWTAADDDRFVTATKALGAQYEAMDILPGAHINGQLTMGENIADLAGVLAALDAYHQSLGGQPAPVIDGLTGDQRFFLAYAQYYRNKVREDSLRMWLVSDPHAPDRARVDVVLANVDAWYAAFDVKPGDKLYVPPAKRVHIW